MLQKALNKIQELMESLKHKTTRNDTERKGWQQDVLYLLCAYVEDAKHDTWPYVVELSYTKFGIAIKIEITMYRLS
jgi:hypothetical protein